MSFRGVDLARDGYPDGTGHLSLIATPLADNSQLRMLWFGVRRLIASRRVIALVTPTRLVCCWQEGSNWRWRSGQWSPGCMRGGVPLQPELMAELLGDLLLDCDLLGVQLELVLPVEGVHWRVLEGWDRQGCHDVDLSAAEWGELGWPLDVENSDVAWSECGDQPVLVGLPRSILQAWINVVELADLSLRRIDWTVTSALRGLILDPGLFSGDLAWVFEDESCIRLVILRAGVPELDCCMECNESSALSTELRRRVAAWQTHAGGSRPLAWCFALPKSLVEQLQSMVDPDRQESDISAAASWWPVAMVAEDEVEGLYPLERMALLGMREDIYA